MAESSDNDRIHKQNTQITSSTHSTFDTQSSSSDVAVQQAINVQILSQLSAISDRLSFRKKQCKERFRSEKNQGSFQKEIQYTSCPGHSASNTCWVARFIYN